MGARGKVSSWTGRLIEATLAAVFASTFLEIALWMGYENRLPAGMLRNVLFMVLGIVVAILVISMAYASRYKKTTITRFPTPM